MFKKDHFKIRKDDYYRILTTEVLPNETPIIFNNFGLYNFLKYDFSDPTAIELQNRLLNGCKKYTIPMSYKIKKNSTEFRKLKLIHPLSQIEVKNFYERYEDVILHYCENSPISIRSPQRVTNAFYKKNLNEDINRFKEDGQITILSSEEISKYSPSFYSYRGFNRLYKFFDSKLFFKSESNFSEYCSVDIAKCFDSIYTHSIGWAVKDKQFTKENINCKSDFGSDFDSLMQRMNHNETNGIVIGPEVSRIFSEIILQEIDSQIINLLKEKYSLEFGKEYLIKRYVDDFFIFTLDKRIQKIVLICLSDSLSKFNLHFNSLKTEYLSRPFITNKSKVIHSIKLILNNFFKKFLNEENINIIKPLLIRDKWKLIRSFIQDIQSECKQNNISYDEVSGYIISTINRRIVKIISNEFLDVEDEKNYLDSLECLIDISFFFFKLSPSSNSCYKISTSIILCIKFVEKNINSRLTYLSKIIYDHIYQYLLYNEEDCFNNVENYFSIEAINLILVSTELGKDFMLPEEMIIKYFNLESGVESNYFHLMSCLYYSSKYTQLIRLKYLVIKKIENELKDLKDFCYNTNKAYLFFDAIFHPDIKNEQKKIWIRKVITVLDPTTPVLNLVTSSALDGFLQHTSQHYWHIDWKNIDLLNYLQKKDLSQAY